MALDIELKLKLLIDLLNKKLDIMTEIYNLTVNEKAILVSDEECFDILKEISSLVKEKTTDVNNIDEQFQKEYNIISKDLSESIDQFKGYIHVMKDLIKSNTELKLKIKLQEEKNSEIIQIK